MPKSGAKKQSTNLSKREVHNAVLKALRKWYEPTREGMEFFAQLRISEVHGFTNKLPVVDSRFALNDMLLAYIEQIGRLKPKVAQVLIRRFKNEQTIKQIAYGMHFSVDQTNRLQRDGIRYLAGLILDDEIRQRAD